MSGFFWLSNFDEPINTEILTFFFLKQKKIHSGTVNVFNCDPQSGLGNIPGHDVGYMPQDYSLHDDLTIAEILSYFGKIYKMDRELIKIKTKELVKLLDLPGPDQVISTLSGGQKRRCSFCCAVIHMPKLLILGKFLL